MARSEFQGRTAYLDELGNRLAAVPRSGADFILLRGRRQVGKSRLITEFLQRNNAPAVYYQATRRPPADELASFTDAVARSTLACAGLVRDGVRFETWEGAFELISSTASPQHPAVVVLDELPYLIERDPAFESVLQRAWDRTLASSPVMLVVVGSDLAMMEALTSYDRPLYGRLQLERAVLPLNVGEVADALTLDAAAAFDAYLTVGGFPRVVLSWPPGVSWCDFIHAQLSDPTSALLVVGERMLAAEFPAPDTVRVTLEAVGHGERAFSALSERSGLGASSLHRALTTLRRKRVVSADEPLSRARGGRATRYRIADPYLRFWLRFVGPALPDVERGRSDLAVRRLEQDWQGYRGRAVEPLVRESLERLMPSSQLGEPRDFGGYWTRAHDVEVDLVGVHDRSRVQRVAAVGSVKWREDRPFSAHDEAQLRRDLVAVPGTDTATRTLAVSRSGFESDVGELVRLRPDDLVRAWT